MAPYLEGLQAIRIGLQDPAQVEEERDDTPGLAEVYDGLPPGTPEGRSHRFRRAGVPSH